MFVIFFFDFMVLHLFCNFKPILPKKKYKQNKTIELFFQNCNYGIYGNHASLKAVINQANINGVSG